MMMSIGTKGMAIVVVCCSSLIRFTIVIIVTRVTPQTTSVALQA